MFRVARLGGFQSPMRYHASPGWSSTWYRSSTAMPYSRHFSRYLSTLRPMPALARPMKKARAPMTMAPAAAPSGAVAQIAPGGSKLRITSAPRRRTARRIGRGRGARERARAAAGARERGGGGDARADERGGHRRCARGEVAHRDGHEDASASAIWHRRWIGRALDSVVSGRVGNSIGDEQKVLLPVVSSPPSKKRRRRGR